MKIFKNRAVAWVVLALAVIGSVCIGLARKDSFLAKEPTALLDVQYRQWICDDAGLLSDETEQLIGQYNTGWDQKYYAVVAVATVDQVTGWKDQEYAAALGKDAPRIYHTIGQEDSLLSSARETRDLLHSYPGDPFHYIYEEKPGKHGWEFCDGALRDFLQWLSPAPR